MVFKNLCILVLLMTVSSLSIGRVKEKSLPHWQVTCNLLTCPKFDLKLGSDERQSAKMVFMDKLQVYHRTILSKFTTEPY